MDWADGILHLGAMAVLMAFGSVGFDRVAERTQSLSKTLNALQKKASEELHQIDKQIDEKIRPDVNGTNVVLRTANCAFLLYMAAMKRPGRLGHVRFGHFCFRFWRAPFVKFFANGWHIIPILLMALGSIAAFIGLIFQQAHEVSGRAYNDIWMILFTTTVIWVLVTVGISWRLNTLEARCYTYLKQFKAEVEAVTQEYGRHSKEAVDAADLSGIGAATP
jgi:hypothetical protein